MAPSYPSNMTPDGRVSLTAQYSASGGLFKMWRRSLRPETYPLLACVGGGIALVAYYGSKHLMYSPDLKLTKTRRRQTILNNEAEGERWVKHHKTLKNMGPEYVKYPKTA